MPGTPVHETFDTIDLARKRHIFAQMTKMLKALQVYQLSESVTGFGYVTFERHWARCERRNDER